LAPVGPHAASHDPAIRARLDRENPTGIFSRAQEIFLRAKAS